MRSQQKKYGQLTDWLYLLIDPDAYTSIYKLGIVIYANNFNGSMFNRVFVFLFRIAQGILQATFELFPFLISMPFYTYSYSYILVFQIEHFVYFYANVFGRSYVSLNSLFIVI